jgi:hypothetical protein
LPRRLIDGSRLCARMKAAQSMLVNWEPWSEWICALIPAFGDLGLRIALELITEIGLPHRRLLSSKLGSKASRNLGAIQKLGAIHMSGPSG